MLKNNMSMLKVMIITCWILLFLAMILKLFGVHWFDIWTGNNRFTRICDYVNNNKILYTIIPIIFNVITTSIYFMAIFKETRPRLSWFSILIVYATLKVLFYNQVVFFIGDIILMIGLPLIINYKLWKSTLIAFIFNFVFQLVSMITKLDNYDIFKDDMLIITILSFDYVIMLSLYMLYRVRVPLEKGVLANG